MIGCTKLVGKSVRKHISDAIFSKYSTAMYRTEDKYLLLSDYVMIMSDMIMRHKQECIILS